MPVAVDDEGSGRPPMLWQGASSIDGSRTLREGRCRRARVLCPVDLCRIRHRVQDPLEVRRRARGWLLLPCRATWFPYVNRLILSECPKHYIGPRSDLAKFGLYG